jgi:hypothetical protein
VVTFRHGIIGAPALSPREWLETKQGFQLYVQAQSRLPLGSYNPRRLLNPGYNRYALEFSVPMAIPLDGARRRTFVEITPEVAWFGDNDDPFGPDVNVVSQDPVYLMEFQLSHKLPKGAWLALGAQYQAGGRTVNDGVPNDNELDRWYAEASLGYVINSHVAVSGSWGKSFEEANGSRSEVLRLRAVLAF